MAEFRKTTWNANTVHDALAKAKAKANAPWDITEEEVVKKICNDFFTASKIKTGEDCEIGEVSWPREGNYAFINSTFVPPSIAEKLKSFPRGSLFSAHCREGRRGRVATAIVPLEEYLGWHPEIVQSIKQLEVENHRRDAEHEIYVAEENEKAFNRKVEQARACGFTLVEIRKEYRYNYSAHGRDEYVFKEDVTMESAKKLLGELCRLHEDKMEGGYFHGEDELRLIDGGFAHIWSDPYTD